MPKAVEEIIEGAQFILQERITKVIAEHNVDVPTPINFERTRRGGEDDTT